MTPTPCFVDMYHGTALPYPTYTEDVTGFAQMVAGGWPFLIHKASQGSFYQDTKVVGRLGAAASVPGMNIGIYHYLDNSPIDMQIGNFMGVYAQVMAVIPKGTFVRLAVDNEPNNLGFEATARTDDWGHMMARAMYMANGRKPLIYGDASEFYSAQSAGFMTSCPRWLARYDGSWATSTECGPGWTNWQWQQFSGDGVNTMGLQVPGFAGVTLDMSAFAGSINEAIAGWNR